MARNVHTWLQLSGIIQVLLIQCLVDLVDAFFRGGMWKRAKDDRKKRGDFLGEIRSTFRLDFDADPPGSICLSVIDVYGVLIKPLGVFLY